jgi:hypothetical protein
MTEITVRGSPRVKDHTVKRAAKKRAAAPRAHEREYKEGKGYGRHMTSDLPVAPTTLGGRALLHGLQGKPAKALYLGLRSQGPTKALVGWVLSIELRRRFTGQQSAIPQFVAEMCALDDIEPLGQVSRIREFVIRRAFGAENQWADYPPTKVRRESRRVLHYIAYLYHDEPERLAALIRQAEIGYLRSIGVRVETALGPISGISPEWLVAVSERDFGAVRELAPAPAASPLERYVAAVLDRLVRLRFGTEYNVLDILELAYQTYDLSGGGFDRMVMQMLIRSSLGESVPICDQDAATVWSVKSIAIIGLLEQLALNDEEAHEILRLTANSIGGQSG